MAAGELVDGWRSCLATLSPEHDVRFGVGASVDEIRAIETTFGFLPPTYAAFLREIGWVSSPKGGIMGSGSGCPADLDVARVAQAIRSRGIDKVVIPISNDRFGNYQCLVDDGSEELYGIDFEFGEGLSAKSYGEHFAEFFRRFAWARGGSILPTASGRQDVGEQTASSESIFESIERLRQAGGDDVGPGAAPEAIARAEEKLGRFPDSYRGFLERFGWLESSMGVVLGIAEDVPTWLDLVTVTQSERVVSDGLLDGLLVIGEVGNGDLYCLRAGDRDEVLLVLHDTSELTSTGASFLSWLGERLPRS